MVIPFQTVAYSFRFFRGGVVCTKRSRLGNKRYYTALMK